MAFIAGLISSNFDTKIPVNVIAYGRPQEKFLIDGGDIFNLQTREEAASPNGVSGQVRQIKFIFSNMSPDNAVTVKAQESDHAAGISDNNQVDSYPFDTSFTDIVGSEVTVQPLGNVSIIVDVTNKPYLAINAKAARLGGAPLRVQTQAVGCQVDRI
jgi:hypothetical protein